MARTYRNLWPDVVAWENLLLAYRKCRRRKRYKTVATAFDFRWEENLLQLQRELCDGNYQPGEYRHFHISEPKPRKISAAPFRDRVVHHALVTILEPIFERRFIYDSYACRRGKGTHRALDRAQYYLRRFDWCLKTDVVRFFPNVDHELLFRQISRSVSDERVLDLITVILRSGEGVLCDEATHHVFPGDDLFSVLRPRGLPIGNLTSQFFANVFLDPIDHFIKEQLRVPGYVRYADDLLLFGDTRQSLWQYRDAVADCLADKRLCLHPAKTHVRPTGTGVSFLGFRVGRNTRRLCQTAIRRFRRRMRQLQWDRKHGRTDFKTIRTSLQAWLVHSGTANTEGLRKDLLRALRF